MASCQTQTCALLVGHVVPFLGAITATMISYAPYAAVQKVSYERSLGDTNTFPLVMMVPNGLTWMLYGLLLKDYYLFVPNLIGYLFGVYYTLVAYRFCTNKQQDEITKIVMGSCGVVFAGAMLAFISFGPNGPSLMGFLCTSIVLIFFAAPLSSIGTVLKTKDASSINGPLATATLINGLLWALYGFALSNAFIYLPNVCGVIFAVAQLVLLRIFTQKDLSSPREALLRPAD
ncbi:sugar efflux transporter for intercellular exchange-domain-containing protein [Gorgonomyces haynaldii]|nr:sugar efflux transporter for intercellular exchange-domain-containing protein [Gorgonomyces haynaldii]